MVSYFIDSLLDIGVEEVVSCPGARSGEILNQILETKKINIQTFYDERSAGFYALGKSLKTNKPVVVLTTSGSAAAALYPALLEARYQEGVKLVAVTADRPEAFVGTGVPQTIVQEDIFLKNKIKTISYCENTNLKNIEYPVHINLFLKDPNPVKEIERKYEYESLVIVSSLKLCERDEVRKCLKNYKGVLVLEPLSNLSYEDFPEALSVKYAESFILKSGINSFKEIYRIGGVPVLKSWRKVHEHLNVFFWNKYKYPGTVGAKGVSLKQISEKIIDFKENKELKAKILKYNRAVESIIKRNNLSEVSMLMELSEKIPNESRVFIGNSLPIREWSFVHWSRFKNMGQRGVNGIDGSLALALGSLDKEVDNWIVLGDLTTLYNLNDLQGLKYLSDYSIKIVVINNFGGRIFENIFNKNKEYFINEQDRSFKKLAAFWDLNYIRYLNNMKFSKQCLIELVVDSAKSNKFWSDLDKVRL